MKQAADLHGFIDENPKGSKIFTDSPLHKNQMIPGIKAKQQGDQCPFGAKDEHNMPVQKSTIWDSNVRLRKATRKCTCGTVPHGQLVGRRPDGLARTALAAVYPWALCLAIILDVVRYIHGLPARHPTYYNHYNITPATLPSHTLPSMILGQNLHLQANVVHQPKKSKINDLHLLSNEIASP